MGLILNKTLHFTGPLMLREQVILDHKICCVSQKETLSLRQKLVQQFF